MVRQTISNLSKSKFVAGCQCPKRLYLQCYHRELAREIDAATQAIFDQGHKVGQLAQKRFRHGVLVEEDHEHFGQALIRTQHLLKDKDIPAIYEAAFAFENIWIRADILVREPDDRWRLIEVKSTTKIKECHLADVGIQKYVLKSCGIETCGEYLMHLSRNYEYAGGEYDLKQLFSIEDLSSVVHNLQDEIPDMIAGQWKVLSGERMPEIEPGLKCKDPYRCEFFEYCNEKLPEHHVSFLPRLNASKLKRLIEMNITLIRDIPDEFDLTSLQHRVRRCIRTGEPYFSSKLKGACDQLLYPLYFMDFETSMPALPRYRRMRPYDQIPFQWSVHVQREPDGELEHHAFFPEDGNDPREAFIQSLLDVLGHEGSIVVYNKAFEQLRLKEIASWLPAYADRIDDVNQRIWDLLVMIRKHVYHPAFNGKFSLKAVLPTLVPEMTYEGMDVAEGSQASLAYEAIVRGDLPDEESAQLRKALLEYCKQDTLAMVRLLEALKNR